MPDLKALLGHFGITGYKSAILTFLLENNKSSSAKEISEKAKVPLPRMYSLLIELEHDGLIYKMNGAVQLFRANEVSAIVNVLKEREIQKIEQQKQQTTSACKQLSEELELLAKSGKQVFRPVIKYYESDADYWDQVISSELGLSESSPRRVLFTTRIMASYTDKELNANPNLAKYRQNLIKLTAKGIPSFYVANPRTCVMATYEEFSDKKEFMNIMINGLAFYYRFRDQITFSLTEDIEHITMSIGADGVFFEFYSQTYSKISSAVEIKGKEIAHDFALWFDSFMRKGKSGDAGFNAFKNRIEHWSEKLVGIKRSEFEKELSRVINK